MKCKKCNGELNQHGICTACGERSINSIQDIEARLAEINAEIETRGDALTSEQLTALNDEVTFLKELREEIESVIEKRAALRQAIASGTQGTTVRTFDNQDEQRGSVPVDKFDTPEYKNAFMNFVCRGVPMPEHILADKFELRAGEATTVADAGAVIPTTTLQELIRKLESYGGIYNKVRKLNIQGGVEVPILTLKPTAKWIGEGSSDDQKIKADESVSFTYYGLECKIAQTLLASVVIYDMFQREFVTLSVEAIIEALEKGIFNGTGKTGKQMVGITKDPRVPEVNKLTISAADFQSWEGWKKRIFAKMKKSYRNGIFAMAQGTFDGYIDGMVDETGQPIARVNYGITEGETYRFGGKSVETVEDDVIVGYDEADSGDVVAVFFNPQDYAINSNMQMTVVKWTDHDDNQVKNKAILIADGKLLDANGVLLIIKE